MGEQEFRHVNLTFDLAAHHHADPKGVNFARVETGLCCMFQVIHKNQSDKHPFGSPWPPIATRNRQLLFPAGDYWADA